MPTNGENSGTPSRSAMASGRRTQQRTMLHRNNDNIAGDNGNGKELLKIILNYLKGQKRSEPVNIRQLGYHLNKTSSTNNRSCLQDIKENHGGIKAFLESNSQFFRFEQIGISDFGVSLAVEGDDNLRLIQEREGASTSDAAGENDTKISPSSVIIKRRESKEEIMMTEQGIGGEDSELIQALLEFLRKQDGPVCGSTVGLQLRKIPPPPSFFGSTNFLDAIKDWHRSIKSFLDKYPQHFCVRKTSNDFYVSAAIPETGRAEPSDVRKDAAGPKKESTLDQDQDEMATLRQFIVEYLQQRSSPVSSRDIGYHLNKICFEDSSEASCSALQRIKAVHGGLKSFIMNNTQYFDFTVMEDGKELFVSIPRESNTNTTRNGRAKASPAVVVRDDMKASHVESQDGMAPEKNEHNRRDEKEEAALIQFIVEYIQQESSPVGSRELGRHLSKVCFDDSRSVLQRIKDKHGGLMAFIRNNPRYFHTVPGGEEMEFLVSIVPGSVNAMRDDTCDSTKSQPATVVRDDRSTINGRRKGDSSAVALPIYSESSEKASNNQLLKVVVEYLQKQRRPVPCRKMGIDLGKVPCPCKNSSSNCQQEIKQQYGSMKAFLNKHADYFQLEQGSSDVIVDLKPDIQPYTSASETKSRPSSANTTGNRSRNNESLQQQEKNHVAGARKTLAPDKSLRHRVDLLWKDSEVKHHHTGENSLTHTQDQQVVEIINRDDKLDNRKMPAAYGDEDLASDKTQLQQDLVAAQQQLASEIQKRRQVEAEKRMTEKLLSSEKRLRGEVERLWKEGEVENDGNVKCLQEELSSLQQQITSMAQERNQAVSEKRQAEKLLATEKVHRDEIERLWKEAEEEYDQSTLQQQNDLLEAQQQLQKLQQAEAEKVKIEKLLAAAEKYRVELERLYNDEKADNEKEIRELQRDLKIETQRRKRFETELLKTENLLSQAKEENPTSAKITRQAKEIQQLQEQLKKERRKGSTHVTETKERRPAVINEFISAKLPADRPAPPRIMTAPRIMKREDFPVKPPQVNDIIPDEPRYDGVSNAWAGNVGDTDQDRRDAEIAVVASSYSKEELRICGCFDDEDGSNVQITRSMSLLAEEGPDSIVMELVLSLPKEYPNESLEVSASLAGNNTSCSTEVRKLALDAIPGLVDLCCREANAHNGSEAISPVLSRADEWLITEWAAIQGKGVAVSSEDTDMPEDRRQAELTVLTSAYSDEEVRVIDSDQTNGCIQILRTLSLPVQAKSESAVIHLQLLLPEEYPEVKLEVEASLVEGNRSCSVDVQKLALDALPRLVDLLTVESQAVIGNEAVLHIISTADEWIHLEWSGIQRKRFPLEEEDCTGENDVVTGSSSIKLCRMLIYTHHLIEQDTIHYAKQTASKLGVGGFLKTGRPGFCLVEGLEDNCDSLLERLIEIQAKVRAGARRGSSTATYSEVTRRISKDGACRIFPNKMCRLEGKGGSKEFQNQCAQVGLLDEFIEASKR